MRWNREILGFRRPGLLFGLLGMIGVPTLPSTAVAAPPSASSHERNAAQSQHLERVGPLQIRARARQRVRGDRPAAASMHVAYAAAVYRWDANHRAELARFEDDRLPDPGARLPKTIVDEPPEAWMAELTLPGLPIRWNARLVEYLHYFKEDDRGHGIAKAWLQRISRYEAPMRRVLAEVGVPEDLVYLALVESGFDPRAASGVGAAGMWQFMEPTARVYGLDGDYWHDERHDHVKSAYAAAAYLQDLHTRFGTWELALAAYNGGYGLVVKTMLNNNTNNFWALTEIENGLPRQTANYVPKILAIAIVAKNPEAFGLELEPFDALSPVEVQVPGGVRLDDIADALGLEHALLREMNAHWVRARVRPDVEAASVLIPKADVAKFEALPDDLRAPAQQWTTTRVRFGEHLNEVASRHGLTGRELRRFNGVHDSGELTPDVLLIVPTVEEPEPDKKDQRSGNSPEPMPQIVAVPPFEAGPGQRRVLFRVTRASTPRRITRTFGVAWDDVVAWNDLAPGARLVDGQFLQLFVRESLTIDPERVRTYREDEVTLVARGTLEHLKALTRERLLVRRGYRTKEGETIARVAKKFDLSTGSLARINGMPRSHRPPMGTVLVVYVPRGETEGTIPPPPPNPTTIGDETRVLSGASDEYASTPETSKLPGHDRPLGVPDSTPGGSGTRAPSTPHSSRVPGGR
jgi:membrane-bound lytic murein transglycosylase D